MPAFSLVKRLNVRWNTVREENLGRLSPGHNVCANLGAMLLIITGALTWSSYCITLAF